MSSLDELNELSSIIIACAIEVHRTLGGPGLIESVYERSLAYELQSRGVKFRRQVYLPIVYKGQKIGNDLKLDLVVEEKIVVECKATAQFSPLFAAQLLTYLRLSGMKLGLVINFGEILVKDGIHRVAN